MTLGFKIPLKIREAADVAQKFYRYPYFFHSFIFIQICFILVFLLMNYIHGMVLKQVANFYNTIHTQMIPSQNGMLVDAAKQFEQVITFKKTSFSSNSIFNFILAGKNRRSQYRKEGCNLGQPC